MSRILIDFYLYTFIFHFPTLLMGRKPESATQEFKRSLPKRLKDKWSYNNLIPKLQLHFRNTLNGNVVITRSRKAIEGRAHLYELVKRVSQGQGVTSVPAIRWRKALQSDVNFSSLLQNFDTENDKKRCLSLLVSVVQTVV